MMAGAALVVAAHGAAAGAEGGESDGDDERRNATLVCSELNGGTLWIDTDGNGVMDTSMSAPCFGYIGTLRFTI
ncbi:hypothetical protein ACE2AJ_02965 [Aquihabitans daechungensis]|uniref:hypothetical protein n=1 Tax=Aquihabitans daechungensis TaxID=1052257 RepID=UPI003B9DDF61